MWNRRKNVVQYLIEEVKVETKYLDQVITCLLPIFCTLNLTTMLYMYIKYVLCNVYACMFVQ